MSIKGFHTLDKPSSIPIIYIPNPFSAWQSSNADPVKHREPSTPNKCVLCLYPLYSDSVWPARAMYLFCPCLYSYGGCTISQCILCLYLLYSVLAWPTRPTYRSYPCLYSYRASTIAQCVLCVYPLYSGLAWAARVMYRSSPCLYSFCVCTIAQCVLCLYLLYTCVCVCFLFPFILDIKFVGRTSRVHTGGRSHRIFHPPSFCGACLSFSTFPSSTVKSDFVYSRFNRPQLVGHFFFFFFNKIKMVSFGLEARNF